MNEIDLKSAVADKLTEFGIWMNKRSSYKKFCDAVADLTGTPQAPGEKPYVYLTRYLGIKPNTPQPWTPPFRPMKAHTHPRLAEIERAQPPMLTPCGTGNYHEYSKFMLNNGRAG